MSLVSMTVTTDDVTFWMLSMHPVYARRSLVLNVQQVVRSWLFIGPAALFGLKSLTNFRCGSQSNVNLSLNDSRYRSLGVLGA